MKSISAVLILLITGGVFAADKIAPQQETKIQPKQIIYKTINDINLKLDLFEPTRGKSQEKLSAIVFFHGGGWSGGIPKQFYPHCEYLASRGIAAISVQYRLISNGKVTPVECVKDAKSAIRWVRKNAGKFGIDPNRIVAAGGSAGGHMALCTAMIEDLEENGEDLSLSSKPNALVLFNPVIDTTKEGYGAEKIKGDTTIISPIHHVKKGICPSIIFSGTLDNLVPIEKVRTFKKQMTQAGNHCEVFEFESKAHGFFNYESEKDHHSYKDTVRYADKFLSSLGYLKGEPTL